MIFAVAALTLILAYVLFDQSRERDKWAKERNLLITRIQTPSYAPALAARELPEPDDDDTYSEERELHQLVHGIPIADQLVELETVVDE